MCIGCWQEHGSPRELPESGAETAELIDQLYALPRCGAGGPLHVVVDDWNVEDQILQSVVDDLDQDDSPAEVLELCRRIGERLLAMTVDQRLAVLALQEKIIDGGT